MLDSITKIKNFMKWCKENNIKSFKVKDLEFELDSTAFIPETGNFEEINLSDSKILSDFDEMTKEEQDELLFWSSGQKPNL